MFFMDSSKQLKLDVITKIYEKKYNVEKAAQILNKTERTIYNHRFL